MKYIYLIIIFYNRQNKSKLCCMLLKRRHILPNKYMQNSNYGGVYAQCPVGVNLYMYDNILISFVLYFFNTNVV